MRDYKMENELDTLINSLSTELRSPSAVSRVSSRSSGGHDSRYYQQYNAEVKRTIHRHTGGREPYSPKRNTLEKGWYSEISKDMGTPRSRTPTLRRHFETLSERSERSQTRSPMGSRTRSPMSRPLSADFGGSTGSMSPRTLSPILRSNTPRYRSLSPKREKSVAIGPVTEMVTKQEYFRHRDAHTGKPLPGEHTFGGSWPYGLDKRQEGRQSPSRGSALEIYGYRPTPEPEPPRRAKSVEPIQIIAMEPKPTPILLAQPQTQIPDWMKNLRHIVPETVACPVPPKFGTLYHGGRRANYSEGVAIGGPPCELCQKPIEERRCIIADHAKYHCWHFVCTFCFKNLRENDFHLGVDGKPYCNNDFRRMYP